MRYPTYEELMEKETTASKIRECALTVCPPARPKRCACQKYDRPIVCATKEKRSGRTRCLKFKPANIDYLQRFAGKDGKDYSFAWNKDLRKYVIYKNNKAMQKFSMASISYAYDIWWELADKLSKDPRRKEARIEPKPISVVPTVTPLTDDEQALFSDILTTTPMHIDEITIASQLSPGKVSSSLLTLELKGLIKRLPGAYFVRRT